MPRRSILSAIERTSIYAVPDDMSDLITRFAFTEQDVTIIKSHRGAENRLGFAVQLAYMRFPGVMLGVEDDPAPVVVRFVSDLLSIGARAWDQYGARGQTRREHLVELQDVYGYQVFTLEHRHQAIDCLVDVARLTDKGIVLAESLVADLRGRKILLPPAGVIERVCAEALTRANRRIYNTLAGSLNDGHRERLDGLLERKDNGPHTWLAWLRLPPGKANSRHVLAHIDRLEKLRALRLPDGVDRLVHQNRLLKIAREGAQMTAGDLAKFETQRRYATMVALVVEATATVTDEIIDLHDRVIIRLMALAKTSFTSPARQ